MKSLGSKFFAAGPGWIRIGQVLLQWGAQNVALNNAAAATAAVGFGTDFASAPFVIVSMNSNSSMYVAASGAVDTDSFNAIGFHRAGTATTATLSVNWLAIGISA